MIDMTQLKNKVCDRKRVTAYEEQRRKSDVLQQALAAAGYPELISLIQTTDEGLVYVWLDGVGVSVVYHESNGAWSVYGDTYSTSLQKLLERLLL